MADPSQEIFYMSDIEKALERDRSTIRTWEDKGWLPESLAFKRDENGWRYWTKPQLDEAIEWLSHRNAGRVAFGLSARRRAKSAARRRKPASS